MRKSKKYVVACCLGSAIAVLLGGCMPKVPPPTLPERDRTPRQTTWSDTSTIERNYSLKPEPYSLDSNENDPELLGPQSTLEKPLSDLNSSRSSSIANEEISGEKGDTSFSSSPVSAMTRSRCMDMIGQRKFQEYSRRFGNEEAALRKCAILERVQR
jgi:hypothetical protein